MQCLYVLDASTLINLHKYLPTKVVRPALVELARLGRLAVPEGVLREVCRRSNRACETLRTIEKKHGSAIVSVAGDAVLEDALKRIETQYGPAIYVGNNRHAGLWQSASGKKAADGQVVAIAKVKNAKAVADDKAIQKACMIEDVPCMAWTEFARRLGLARQANSVGKGL